MKKYLVLLGLLLTQLSSNAFSVEDFYWRDSYGRGVGTVPALICEGNTEQDGGLCYPKCRDGYKGSGPLCNLSESSSYGRGAGNAMKFHGTKLECKGNEDKDGGLCYPKCRDGYHGVGPVCHNNKELSYGRGAGKAMASVCVNDKEKDAGLCYPHCRENYGGVGPVCWSDTPTNWVPCAAGVARSKQDCGIILADQVASIALPALAAIPASEKTAAASMVAKYTPKFGKYVLDITKDLPGFLKFSETMIESGAKESAIILAGAKKGSVAVADLKSMAINMMIPILESAGIGFKRGVMAGAELEASVKNALTALLKNRKTGYAVTEGPWDMFLTVSGVEEFFDGTDAEWIASLRNLTGFTAFVLSMIDLTQPEPTPFEAAASVLGVVSAYSFSIYDGK